MLEVFKIGVSEMYWLYNDGSYVVVFRCGSIMLIDEINVRKIFVISHI